MLKQVADGVLVHESVFVQSNAVVVQGRDGVLLVDPGVTEAEMECLADDLDELGRTVVVAFSTHPDWDHVLWHPRFGSAPRYGTALGAATMAEQLADPATKGRIAEHLPPEIHGQVPMDLLGLITGLPDGAAEIPWDGPRVRVVEHRGHAPGHAALLVVDRGVLVAGDMLSDVLVPMLDAEDAAHPVEDYLAALDLFDRVVGDVDVVVPGHGSVGGPGQLRARIDLDRAYVHALRDAEDRSDPRVGPSARDGWDWVAGVHEWQVEQLARRGQRDGSSGHASSETAPETP